MNKALRKIVTKVHRLKHTPKILANHKRRREKCAKNTRLTIVEAAQMSISNIN